MRRRNSWDSSSGCSNSSEFVQLRPPTSPAIVVARRPQPATHKAPRRKRPGSEVYGRGLDVVTLGATRAHSTLRGRRGGRAGCCRALLLRANEMGGVLPRERVAFQGWQKGREKAKFTELATIGRASCDVPRQRPKGIPGQPRGKELGQLDRPYPECGACLV